MATVLLVDDDATTREVLSVLLAAEGWGVLQAEDGAAALVVMATAERVPQVVLCDLQMPGLRGSALAAALRQAAVDRNERRGPMLIAMTATAMADRPVRGFDALLVKPFEARAVGAIWQRRTGERAAVTDGPHTVSPAGAIDQDVFDKLKQSLNASQLRGLYDVALNDADQRIARMDAFATTGDEKSFQAEAHALKGGCGMVGAVKLKRLAARAELKGLRREGLTAWSRLPDFTAAVGAIRHMLKTLLSDIE